MDEHKNDTDRLWHIMRAVRLYALSSLLATLWAPLGMGQGWDHQSSPTNVSLLAVHFSDADNGWAVGDLTEVIRTTNGGKAWTEVEVPVGTTANLCAVFFVDKRTGWIAGADSIVRIVHTTDGGETWIQQASPVAFGPYSVDFVDSNDGWMVGSSGNIIHTANGGSQWIQQTSGTTAALFSVDFSDMHNGWAVGAGETVLHTTNGGENWNLLPMTGGQFRSVYFQDIDHGWIAAQGGRTFRTTNGGDDWILQQTSTLNLFFSISFTDLNNGWVVGEDGTVFHTTDGGSLWRPNTQITRKDLFSVHFPGINNGWAVGENGTILHTIPVKVGVEVDSLFEFIPAEGDTFDYSITVTNLVSDPITIDVWTKVLRPIGNPIDPLFGPSTIDLEPQGVVVIDSALMPVPFNAWSGEYQLVAYIGTYGVDTVNSDTTSFFKLPYIPCEDIVHFQARCRPGGVMQTRIILVDTTHTGDIVAFTIDDVVYETEVTRNGRAVLSLSGFNLGTHTVELTEPGGCYDPIEVLCSSGTDRADNRIWADDASWETPATTTLFAQPDFGLVDNYPNPFNPSTTFRYGLSEPGQVSLKIYNMIGQLVKTVVNDYQSEGYHEVKWDGRNEMGGAVASGIYVYRLVAGSFVQTRKMVVMK